MSMYLYRIFAARHNPINSVASGRTFRYVYLRSTNESGRDSENNNNIGSRILNPHF